jgi:RNA polymerase sigma factor (sigma-70 family)
MRTVTHATGGQAPTGAAESRTTDIYADWQEVYRDNVAGIHRLIHSRVGNRPDAEDLTAEVFVAALRPLRLPARVPAVRAYLVATARTVMASFWRRHYAAPVTPMPTDALTWNGDEALDPPAGVARATEILSRLPDRSRTILELRFLRGYSIREAATEMAVSTANAKVLQHRALRHAAALGSEIAAESPSVEGRADRR